MTKNDNATTIFIIIDATVWPTDLAPVLSDSAAWSISCPSHTADKTSCQPAKCGCCKLVVPDC